MFKEVGMERYIYPHELTSSLRIGLSELLLQQSLPDRLPWKPDVRVEVFDKSGVWADRANAGKFRVYLGEQWWFFDGGVTKTDIEVRWIYRVDHLRGNVMASPYPRVMPPDGQSELLRHELGMVDREIGNVGPLEALFSETDLLGGELSLPIIYGPADLIARARKEILSSWPQLGPV